MSTEVARPASAKHIIMENVRIIFKNFTGLEGTYNRAGDRNFGVLIENETAAAMEQNGWPIKYLRPREEEDLPQAWLKVKIKLDSVKPPRIVLITSRGRTELPDELVGMIDWAEIANVDLKIRRFDWDFNGKQGTTAYLESIYVTIVEDALERKYADLPDTALGAIEAKATPLEITDGEELVLDGDEVWEG